MQAASRLRKNAIYFRDNYIIIMLLTTAVTFLMHPSSLLVLGALAAAWIYVLMIRTAPIKIGERTLRYGWKSEAGPGACQRACLVPAASGGLQSS